MARPEGTLTAAAAPEGTGPDAEPARRRGRPRRALGWGLVVVLLATVGIMVWRLQDAGPAPLTRADVAKTVEEGIARARAEQRQAPPDATVAYATIVPSLVTITTDGASSARSDGGSAEGALGAGTVVNADGSVLTALHVVDGAKAVTVRFADGTRAKATISARQDDQDIAVLSVDRLPGVVVPAVLGGGARVGDAVFPVGNPFGLERTLSAGVVSATGRSVRTDAGVTIKGLIQFDAAVNPGSSGGPLLDRDGRVVGVVTALANPGRQPFFVGIGFAVPIETAGGAAGGPSI